MRVAGVWPSTKSPSMSHSCSKICPLVSRMPGCFTKRASRRNSLGGEVQGAPGQGGGLGGEVQGQHPVIKPVAAGGVEVQVVKDGGDLPAQHRQGEGLGDIVPAPRPRSPGGCRPPRSLAVRNIR